MSSVDIIQKEVMAQEAVRNLQAMARARGTSLDLTKNPEYNRAAAEYLQKHLGQKLAAYLCGATPRKFGQWVRGKESVDHASAQFVDEILGITRLLATIMKDGAIQTWWVSPNDYLGYFVPMDEIFEDPSWVRQAALSLVTPN